MLPIFFYLAATFVLMWLSYNAGLHRQKDPSKMLDIQEQDRKQDKDVKLLGATPPLTSYQQEILRQLYDLIMLQKEDLLEKVCHNARFNEIYSSVSNKDTYVEKGDYDLDADLKILTNKGLVTDIEDCYTLTPEGTTFCKSFV
jgi:hypothetical protein